MLPEPRQRLLLQQRAEAARSFPAKWAGLIREWKQPGADDCAWLMYSGSYLLRTAGVRWAIDPLRLEHRLPGAPGAAYAADLAPLSFVVLTHSHADHLDAPLIRSLAHLRIPWVVPLPLRRQVIGQAGIPIKRIITPQPLQPIELCGVRLTPFDGLHWEKESHGLRGVPAVGYLAEFAGRRWLFPGDTRTYDASALPCLGPLDGLFAHVWLGRGCASLSMPPLLEAFCRFFLALQPRRIVLTHLRELGRQVDEYWDLPHAELIISAFQQLCPGLPVMPALPGDRVLL